MHIFIWINKLLEQLALELVALLLAGLWVILRGVNLLLKNGKGVKVEVFGKELISIENLNSVQKHTGKDIVRAEEEKHTGKDKNTPIQQGAGKIHLILA